MLRFLLSLTLLAVLANNFPAYSGTPPELKEIFSLYPFAGRLLSLGAFDTASKVRNACAVDVWFPADTWYLRTINDTSNSFTWKNGAPLAIGDFNGDTFDDYWMFKGGILLGRGKGIPPDTTIMPARSLNYFTYVYDYNRDGKDDIVILSNDAQGLQVNPKRWGALGYGSESIAAMKFIPIYAPHIDTTKQDGLGTKVVKVYPKGNEYRVLWEEYSNVGLFYYIGRLVQRDTAVFVERLTSMKFGDPEFGEYCGFVSHNVYYNRNTDEATLIAMRGDTGVDVRCKGTLIFSLDRDTFDLIKHYPYLVSESYTFEESHGVPYNEGWAALGKYPKENFREVSFNFFAGSPRTSVRVAVTKDYTTTGGSIYQLQSIGDITNDNIPDYVLAKGDFLRLLDGSPSFTNVVDDTIIVFQSPTPHPIQKSKVFTVSLGGVVGNRYSLSLYSLDGALIAPLCNGTITSPGQLLSLNISDKMLSVGTYVLRYDSGVDSKSQIVLITE